MNQKRVDNTSTLFFSYLPGDKPPDSQNVEFVVKLYKTCYNYIINDIMNICSLQMEGFIVEKILERIKEIEYKGIKYVLNDELIRELLEIIESDKQSLEVK